MTTPRPPSTSTPCQTAYRSALSRAPQPRPREASSLKLTMRRDLQSRCPATGRPPASARSTTLDLTTYLAYRTLTARSTRRTTAIRVAGLTCCQRRTSRPILRHLHRQIRIENTTQMIRSLAMMTSRIRQMKKTSPKIRMPNAPLPMPSVHHRPPQPRVKHRCLPRGCAETR